MNTSQVETLEKVFTAMNQGIQVHSFGETMVVNTPKKITNPISFKTSSVLQMLCFLWNKAKNCTLVLSDDKRTHKITVMPYSENGVAKFTLQILLLPTSRDQSNSVVHVESLLPKANQAIRTQQAHYPHSAERLMASGWFSNLRVLLGEFNALNISI